MIRINNCPISKIVFSYTNILFDYSKNNNTTILRQINETMCRLEIKNATENDNGAWKITLNWDEKSTENAMSLKHFLKVTTIGKHTILLFSTFFKIL